MRRYRALGLHDTPAHRIYSEASIGKAYLRAMGVKPWREVQPDFPPRLLGIIMSTYFGGRSEVRIRRELREVVLCDFLSMYPTVCTLMRLWSFVIAQGMTWRDATDGTRALLGRVTLDDLQRQETWSRLATLVRVMPDGDLFPIRARYEEGGQATIGLNSAKSTKALWFTLADCIASRLLTGRTPQILEAIAFEAGEPQTGLEPVNVSGKAAYRVDPTRDDLFKRTIELRHEVKVRAANSAGGERDALESEQLALKILANATSYGGFVEVNVQEKAKAQAVTVHCGGDAPYVSLTSNLEVPGRYFHPLLATLITGAARLKLAITERLASDRGLEWAFCDTDSMALAKPPTMQRDVFNERVSAVVEWFTPLNPYEFSGPILKVEGVNFDIVSREREPLFSWAVSAKRYALFNVTPDGTPVLRKASAHGLGHLRAPYDDSNPAPGLPRPAVSLAELGVELWQHDLWFAIVSAAVSGGPNSVNLSYHPALSQPAVSQYSATTPALLQWFQRYNRGRPYSDQVKPLGFLFSLFATRFDPASSRPRRGIARPVATFDRDHQAACRNAFDRETGEAIGEASLKSYHQLLAQYHLQPEAKFLNGDYLDRGTTVRRLVEITGVNHIGKEANRWEEQEHLGLDDDAAVTYGSGGQEFESLRRPLRELSNEIGQREIAAALGCSRSRIAMLLGSSPIRLARREVERLRSAVARLFEEQAQRRAEHERNRRFVQAIATESGLAVAAAAIAVDPSNLAKVLSGKRRMSAAASERLRELTANGVGRRSN